MINKSRHSLDLSVALLASFVYLVQGALSLAGVAFPLLLREKGWSISEISTFSFLVGLPWALKIVYGALSDGFPIVGYRRKPYVILASLISIISWIGLALFYSHRACLYAFSVIGNLGFALTDVVTDALVVERSTETNAQIYQSLSWGFRSAGAVVGGVLGGWLAQNIPYHWVFALTAALPLTTLVTGIFIRESPAVALRKGFSAFLTPIVDSLRALMRGDLRWFSALLLVSSFSAAFSTPFFFFLKEKLGFSETLLGTLSSLTWLGAMGGCFLYARHLKDVSLKKMLRWSIWLNALNVLSAYLIINLLNAATLSFLGGIIGYLSFLPLITTAALLSRQEGIEGSLFAVLMSVNNLGQLLSTFIGGKLFDIIGLNFLILFSAGVGLTGLFFVDRLRFTTADSEDAG